jgi:hypothetical protein
MQKRKRACSNAIEIHWNSVLFFAESRRCHQRERGLAWNADSFAATVGCVLIDDEIAKSRYLSSDGLIGHSSSLLRLKTSRLTTSRFEISCDMRAIEAIRNRDVFNERIRRYDARAQHFGQSVIRWRCDIAALLANRHLLRIKTGAAVIGYLRVEIKRRCVPAQIARIGMRPRACART